MDLKQRAAALQKNSPLAFAQGGRVDTSARRKDRFTNPRKSRILMDHEATGEKLKDKIGIHPIVQTALGLEPPQPPQPQQGLTLQPSEEADPTARLDPTAGLDFPTILWGEDPGHHLTRDTVFKLWLRGYTRQAIAGEIGLKYGQVSHLIKQIKRSIVQYLEDNPQLFGRPMELVYCQVLRRRERQSALWEEIRTSPPSSRKSQYYKLIAAEDNSIESLLGLDHKTLSVILGSPQDHLQASMVEKLGPEGMKELLSDLRHTHQVLTGEEEIVIINGDLSPITDQTRI